MLLASSPNSTRSNEPVELPRAPDPHQLCSKPSPCGFGTPVDDGSSRRQLPAFDMKRGPEIGQTTVHGRPLPRIPTRRPLYVVLICESGLAIAGFTALLHNEPDVVRIETASSIEEGAILVRETDPDLIILGAECLKSGHAGALRTLKQEAGLSRLLLISSQSQQQSFAELVAQGADAIVMYESDSESFSQVLHNMLHGTPFLDPLVQKQIVLSLQETAQTPVKLSARELQVLRLVARGNPNKTIADALKVSEGTVKTYMRRLRLRLGARDRTHAVIHAVALGLVEVSRG